jgi:hypothetical protein
MKLFFLFIKVLYKMSTTHGAVVVVIVWSLDLQLPIQSVFITTNVVSSNPAQAIQHYVIKFVSDLRYVGGFSGYSGFLHQ